MPDNNLPKPSAAIADRTVITVEETSALLGIGRSAAYEAARRGDIPTRRLGRRVYVPVPALLDWLGVREPPHVVVHRDRRRHTRCIGAVPS
jgi:excisionase family DNA binding protein